MEFPAIIPVFPLPNVVLFPGVPLPLHIFEPRYRTMVRDAADGHELIGMALLRGDWRRRYEGNPDIYEIGCAGRLVNVEALPDGKFNIVLHGVREFLVRRHLFDKPYRQAEVEWRAAAVQSPLELDSRARLLRVLTDFLRPDPDSPAGRLLSSGSLSDELLVNFFSYALDIPPLEKQGLLEARSLDARGRRLADVIEFQLAASRLGPTSSGSDRCH
jgi:Lon protease-like protein